MTASSALLGAAPHLRTARLRLGAFGLEDATALQQLAGDRQIADTTVSIPHPYELDHALAWITHQRRERVRGRAINFAVRLGPEAPLIGSVGLRNIDPAHRQAELGFWIGVGWWGHGYASEAAEAVIRYGFERLGLNRICAHHMVRNPAAGRVMLRLGMRQEGIMRERVLKWGLYEDVVLYGLLREDRN